MGRYLFCMINLHIYEDTFERRYFEITKDVLLCLCINKENVIITPLLLLILEIHIYSVFSKTFISTQNGNKFSPLCL